MNPNLGYPTLSKKVELQNKLQSLRNLSAPKKREGKALTKKTPGEDNLNPWLSIGPNDVGGRTRGALFDLNDTEKDRVIAGGVSGGLWINEDIDKSTSSSWTQVTGVPGNLAISVIVQNPNDHSVMYAGTGESYTGSDAMGNGIYKSTDYGQNWTKVFGNFSGTVTTTVYSGSSQVTVEGYFYINDLQIWDPTPSNSSNNDEYIFATVGQGQDASNEYAEFYDLSNSGLWVSVNAGATWTKCTLPTNSNSRRDDLNDLEVDPNNNKLWVSSTRNQNWDPGSNFYFTTNGSSFTKVSPSFPSINSANIGRVEIAPSSTTVDLFYILLATTSIPTQAEIFKTTDGFATLTKLNEPNDVDNGISATDFTRGQSFYDLEVEVDPNNDDIVYVGGINLFRSTDGGTNWSQISKWSNNPNQNTLSVSLVHADQHGIYFKPGDSDKGIVVNDGGVYYASSFSSASSSDVFTSQESGFVTTQFYKVAQSPHTYGTDYIFGGTQDNGTLQLDNSSSFSGLTGSSEFSGGDGGFPYIDQVDTKYLISNYIYNDAVLLKSLNGTIYSNGFTEMYISNSSDLDTSDDTEGDFINPGALDSNLDILYVNGSKGTNYKIRRFRDLDTSSPTDDYISSGIPNSPSAFHVSTYTSTSTTLLVGTDKGEVLLITNADNVGINISQIANFVGSVSNLKFGSSENEIYATFYNYGVNNVYYSSDRGSSWSVKDGDLPDLPVLAIQPNPYDSEEVIIGTDLGVWKTTNFSAANPSWTQSNNGMTDVRVNDFEIRGTTLASHRVVASTYGRGIFTGTFSSSDITSPTVVLTDTDADNIVTNSDVVTITATFSESMSATPTISLTGIVTDQLMTGTTSASQWVYAWTVSTAVPSTTATVSGTDLAGNYYTGTESITFTVIDTTSPTVTLTDTDANNMVNNSDVVTITATFSESMSATPTISLTGIVTDQLMTGTTSASQWVYAWTVSTTVPSTTATVSGTDLAGNYYTGTDSITFTILNDSVSPTVVLTDTDADNIVTNSDVVTITATFSESMSATPTISLTGIVTDQLMTGTTSASQWVYAWTVSTAVPSTTATVSGTDLAGNYYTGTESITFTVIDTTSPTVTLTDTDANNMVTNSDVVTITATFSESMSATPTISLTGIVTDQIMTGTTSASQWVYAWTVSTTVPSTTATVSGTDLAGNYYTGTDSITFTILNDSVSPTVVLTDTDADNIVTNSDVVTITATFSESMSATPTISLTGIVTDQLMTGTTSASQWVYAWTVSTTVPSTTATVSGTDLAGNYYTGTDSITFTILNDSVSPTVVLTDTDADNIVTNSDVVTITATFSESMSATPTISFTGIVTDQLMTGTTSASQWVYAWTVSTTVPSTTATVSGTDLAGNYYTGTDSITYVISNTTVNIDSDNDGVLDSIDNCPFVANTNQADGDNDGVGDFCDNCVSFSNSDQNDSDGDGGGNVCDDDDDNDGYPDAIDSEPLNPNEWNDNDNDGIGDNADSDDDNDGILDQNDNCPLDANANQTDLDGDGKGDACDLDADGDGFTYLDEASCGTSDQDATSYPSDIDNDLIADCVDDDSDNDGYKNKNDRFPLDPNEHRDNDDDGIGDNTDLDDDNDNYPDQDEIDCGSDPLNEESLPLDFDGDLSPDCLDLDDDNDNYSDLSEMECDSNPLDAESVPNDFDGDLSPDCVDTDDDNDNYLDVEDYCPYTPLGEAVGLDGCVIFYLPAKNFNVFKTERCVGENSITVQVEETTYTYQINLSGALRQNDSFRGSTWSIDNLSGGIYSICITVDGVAESIFQRCFEVTITDPDPLNVFAMANLDNETVTYNLKGGSVYKITHNGKTTQTQKPTHTVALEKGMNKVTITTGIACQGIFEATYLNSHEVQMAPNPFKEQLFFNVGGTDRDIQVEVYAPDGRLIKTRMFSLSASNRVVVLPTDDLIQGSYYIKVIGENTDQSFTAIKE